ncbi:MAG: response regulator [Magnetococcales bacterium]|nr:response regulator [Magnetococcales bacterium]
MQPVILIVDDTPANVTLLMEQLADLDAERLAAFSGAEALYLMTRHECAVVLLDAAMPEMDGFEVLRQMAVQETLCHTPVIMLTAVHNDTRHIAAGYGLGAVDYLVKPYSPFILKSKIKVFLELARQRAMISSQAQALEVAMRKAEVAAMAKDLFLANMSHEIRTPMHVIIGLTDLLLASEMPPEQKRFLEIVLQSSEALLNILNDILVFSKIDTDAFTLEHKSFSPRLLVEQVGAAIAEDARAKGLVFACGVDEDLPDRLMGDPLRLRQVLFTLLGNAVKFTPAGEVELRVLLGEGGTLRMLVRDTGIGIPEEKQELIFQLFSQADGTPTRPYGGVGLGLTICRLLVWRMGGGIALESREGRGSRFTVTIPLLQAAGSGVCPAPRETDPPARILLVEGDRELRLSAERLLQEAGYAVTTATDGDEALKLLGEGFDLVFMDFLMPRLNGIETTRRIRAGREKADPDLPIIGLGNPISPMLREHCLEAGMDEVLVTPHRSEELLTLAARAGALRRARIERRQALLRHPAAGDP